MSESNKELVASFELWTNNESSLYVLLVDTPQGISYVSIFL